MRKIGIKKLLVFIFIIGIILGGLALNNKKDTSISKVLEKNDYSYLPTEAQNYIKEVYEKTGEVVLTEKNKKENQVYLNPRYVDYLALSAKEKEEVDAIPPTMIIDYPTDTIANAGYIPSRYDLRNVSGNNYVTPNRDQGQLGICWAFATAGVTESHLLKTKNQTYTSSAQLISERQLDYAASENGIKDYTNEYILKIISNGDGTSRYRSLGEGGNFYLATVPMASGVALIDYNNFKTYNDTDKTQMELQEILNYNKSLYEAITTTNFPSMNLREYSNEPSIRSSYLNEVKQNIMDNGAAYTQTYMHSSCYYKDSTNNTIIDVNNCTETDSHAMQIIGWDDNFEYSYCADNNQHKASTSNCSNVVTGQGAWILKNSWGTSIPNPYLAYDSYDTTIAFLNEIESKNYKDWDNNYTIGESQYIYPRYTYYFSDTKIKGTEQLKKIKIITENIEKNYSIDIYSNGNVYSYSVTSDLPGLVTLDIPDYIEVDNKSTITISGLSNDEYGYFLGTAMFFTSNIDTTPYINMDSYKGITLNQKTMRFYSDTKNIPSSGRISYELYDSNNTNYTNKLTVTNNVVAENNVNPILTFASDLPTGTYSLKALYNSQVIETVNITNPTSTYVPKYTIVFNANGGTGSMSSISAPVGQYYTLPENTFTKENYEFTNWNTRANGTGTSYNDMAQITGQDKQVITLYAQWIGAEKTVMFNANGGTVTPRTKTVRYGEPYGELPIPEREGYAFTGWTCDNVPINANTIVEDKLYLKANWENRSYNIVYDANGGTFNNNSTTSMNIISEDTAIDYGTYGNDKVISNNIFINQNLTFKEWNTNADGTGTSYHPEDIINFTNVENNTFTLYAIWEMTKYTITFNMRGSTLTRPPQMTVSKGEIVHLPTVVNNKDYIFEGWYKDYNCTIRFTDTTISSDITVYAKYTLKISNVMVKGIVNKYYTGKNIGQSITVYHGPVLLKQNTDYKITYSNNKNIGTATVTITGINNYSQSIKKTFKIIPKAPTLKKVTSPGKKKATIQYNTVSGGVYYQIAYRKGKDWKTFLTKKTKVTKKMFTSKKYYYFKVRAYRKVGNTVYFSPWSNTKKVKIK